jgi:hypothetical protein
VLYLSLVRHRDSAQRAEVSRESLTRDDQERSAMRAVVNADVPPGRALRHLEESAWHPGIMADEWASAILQARQDFSAAGAGSEVHGLEHGEHDFIMALECQELRASRESPPCTRRGFFAVPRTWDQSL